jgi:hypothetical protein
VAVVQHTEATCPRGPFCSIWVAHGGGNPDEPFASAFLDEHLSAGTYSASFSAQQTNDYQVTELQVVIVDS